MEPIEPLKRAYGLAWSKKLQLDKKIEELSFLIAKRTNDIPANLLEELEQFEKQQAHLKQHLTTLQQDLSKRGLTTAEIKAIQQVLPGTPEAANVAIPAFPSLPKPPSSTITPEQHLISTIQNERFHQQHINEVEQWNKQEQLRQQQIREQNLKLQQMAEQLQLLKLQEEAALEQKREEVKLEEARLEQARRQLDAKQQEQLALIEAKLAELRREKQELALRNQDLSAGQQAQIFALENQRNQILSPALQQANQINFPSFPAVSGSFRAAPDSNLAYGQIQNSSPSFPATPGTTNLHSGLPPSPQGFPGAPGGFPQIPNANFPGVTGSQLPPGSFPQGTGVGVTNLQSGLPSSPQGFPGSQGGTFAQGTNSPSGFPQTPNTNSPAIGNQSQFPGGFATNTPQRPPLPPGFNSNTNSLSTNGSTPGINQPSNSNSQGMGIASGLPAQGLSMHLQQATRIPGQNMFQEDVSVDEVGILQGSVSGIPTSNPEVDLWREEQRVLQSFHDQQSNLQSQHLSNLQIQEEQYKAALEERAQLMRQQWEQQYGTPVSQPYPSALQSMSLTDDVLRQMSEAELRLYMDHAQKNQYLEEMLARRKRLLDEQAWLLQQDVQNKQMALTMREEDIRFKEQELLLQREAELRALNRVFTVFIETTNPEGKKTNKVYQMQVRAGDTVFRVCERIPHDNELFSVVLEFNGVALRQPDKTLIDLQIPDNARLLSKLEPKADVDPLNLIPCEDCGKRFHAEVFAAHKCMKNFSQVLPSDRRKPASGASVVPRGATVRVQSQKSTPRELQQCQYCDGYFPSANLRSHLNSCSRRPVARVTRYS